MQTRAFHTKTTHHVTKRLCKT